jgi:hypothetical protein
MPDFGNGTWAGDHGSSREVRADAGGAQLTRKPGLRTATALAAALLLAIAVAGCNRGANERPSLVSGPVASTGAGPSAGPASEGAPQLTVAPGGSTEAAGSGDLSASPSSNAEATASAGAPASPDPVASELDQIQQLINDINDSLSSSDSSQQGGE